jgi:hypothetical protein
MTLPNIFGDINISADSFYFGCDSIYFEKYGISLINSLKKYAPWANIHVHIFDPFLEQIKLCKDKNITCSYEYTSISNTLLTTYYSCIRFIRIPEIFIGTARIISLDCDGVAVKEISKEIFLEFTKISTVLWRDKHQRSLASSVFFGCDDFRIVYAKRLKEYFISDTAEWYLDQNVMDEMVFCNEVNTTNSTIWGNPKSRDDTLIWTGKGDIKNTNEIFKQKVLDNYAI